LLNNSEGSKIKEKKIDPITTKLRKVNDTELKKILQAHTEWLESKGKTGAQASLTEIDLSGAYLAKANLSKANLYRAHLPRANLSGTNLSGANLSCAMLNKADFSNSNLFDADLSAASLYAADFTNSHIEKANFVETDLAKADFTEAYCFDTDFSGAIFFNTNCFYAEFSDVNLSHVDLTLAVFTSAKFHNVILDSAILAETVFTDVNLSEVVDLDKCEINGPCSIDHRTILKSHTLSDLFLRECGFPDELIEYLPSLLNRPIQFYSCFISYSHKDENFAKRLYADMQSEGIRCWYAPEDLKIGDKIRPRIDEAIRLHEKLLIILSENSVESEWVEHEVETAIAKEAKEKRTVLFPIKLDDKVLDIDAGWASLIKNIRHIGDFSRWKDHDKYSEAFQRLCRDLKNKQP